jgi:hypothetical protein
MEKEQLREMVKKSVKEVWYNRRSMNPVEDQTELLTEALHQALSMSGVVGRSEQLCDLDGKSVRVKFKATKHIPKIVIEDI